jgi:hypothetical protein
MRLHAVYSVRTNCRLYLHNVVYRCLSTEELSVILQIDIANIVFTVQWLQTETAAAFISVSLTKMHTVLRNVTIVLFQYENDKSYRLKCIFDGVR